MSRVSPTNFDRYVSELLEGRTVGERLVFLLDHVGEDDEPSVVRLLEDADVRVVAAPLGLIEEDYPSWWDYFDSVVVPPLSLADAQSLASRLLAGLGHGRSDALALAIEQACAGIPRLIHLLVDRVHVDPTLAEPGRIPGLLDDLVAERGDPSGLRARLDGLQVRKFDEMERRALDLAADAPTGLSPDELRAGILDAEVTSTQVRHTIQLLLDQGWLVERDGRIACEHPLLQEHWKAARQRDHSAWYSEDIPF
jgi:hypothetical protein